MKNWIIGIATSLIAASIWACIQFICCSNPLLLTPTATPTTTITQTSPTTPTTTTQSSISTSKIGENMVPVVVGESITAEIQGSSKVLACSTETTLEGSHYYNTYTLSGFATVVIVNPTVNDATVYLTIDFKISQVPSLDIATIQLKNEESSWSLVTIDPNEL